MPWEPFMDSAHKGILRAQELSEQYASHIDTPHLIVGMLKIVFELQSDFAVLLARHNITPAFIEEEFKNRGWLAQPARARQDQPIFTPNAKLAIEKTFASVRADHAAYVSPEYLIQGCCQAFEKVGNEFSCSSLLVTLARQALGIVVQRTSQEEGLLSQAREALTARVHARQMIRDGLLALAKEALETRDQILAAQVAMLQRAFEGLDSVDVDRTKQFLAGLDPTPPSTSPSTDPGATGTDG